MSDAPLHTCTHRMRTRCVARGSTDNGGIEVSHWKEPGSDLIIVRGRTILTNAGTAEEIAAMQCAGNSDQVATSLHGLLP